MASRRIDTAWRGNFGGNHKELGDFACYLLLYAENSG